MISSKIINWMFMILHTPGLDFVSRVFGCSLPCQKGTDREEGIVIRTSKIIIILKEDNKSSKRKFEPGYSSKI